VEFAREGELWKSSRASRDARLTKSSSVVGDKHFPPNISLDLLSIGFARLPSIARFRLIVAAGKILHEKTCSRYAQVLQPRILIFFLPGTSHGCYLPITSEPYGYSALKMLTKVKGSHTSHITKKTMATGFFNVTRLHMIEILPQNQEMDAEYFSEHMIPSLVSICYPTENSCRQRKWAVHFDNTRISDSTVVVEKSAKQNLKRMPHPAYSLDLSP
jgi:hypothetical protein